MQPYQFETTVSDGYIRVPDDCELTSGIRIIVTIMEKEIVDWEKRFPPRIDTKSWKFNREEANER